jgi:hypothetical protein
MRLSRWWSDMKHYCGFWVRDQLLQVAGCAFTRAMRRCRRDGERCCLQIVR